MRPESWPAKLSRGPGRRSFAWTRQSNRRWTAFYKYKHFFNTQRSALFHFPGLSILKTTLDFARPKKTYVRQYKQLIRPESAHSTQRRAHGSGTFPQLLSPAKARGGRPQTDLQQS